MVSVAEQAAEWLMRLEDGADQPDLQAQFQQWQAQDPAHAEAVQQLQGLIHQLEGLRPQSGIAHQALQAGVKPHRKQAKRAANMLAALLVFALPVGMLLQHYPLAYWLSDLHTATAEWQSARLPDQSHITLNGHTAVDVDFSGKLRALHLHQGEILVDVAKDAARPFVVNTPQGSVTALGTRFVVSQRGDVTEVAMLESKVRVASGRSSGEAGPVAEIVQGEAIEITPHGLGKAHAIDPVSISDAWRLHQLVVQDQPLPEVLATLARHRKGYLRFDAGSLARYQVTAVLPLDDTDRALALLTESFPLRVKRFTPWLVTVQDAAATDSR